MGSRGERHIVIPIPAHSGLRSTQTREATKLDGSRAPRVQLGWVLAMFAGND
jgi:hypothetical protein